jgi:hypothetical protein
MSRYIYFTKLKHLIFINGGSIVLCYYHCMVNAFISIFPILQEFGNHIYNRAGNWGKASKPSRQADILLPILLSGFRSQLVSFCFAILYCCWTVWYLWFLLHWCKSGVKVRCIRMGFLTGSCFPFICWYVILPQLCFYAFKIQWCTCCTWGLDHARPN